MGYQVKETDRLLAKVIALRTLQNCLYDINTYYRRRKRMEQGKYKPNSAIGWMRYNAADAKLWIKDNNPDVFGFKWCMSWGEVRPKDFKRALALALRGLYKEFQTRGRL